VDGPPKLTAFASPQGGAQCPSGGRAGIEVSEARPTPLPLRLYRTVRVSAHLVEGLMTTVFVFPWVGAPRKEVLIRGWSKRLLRMLKVEARIHGLPTPGLPGNLLIVANHISWLDIFVINSLQPARFIAKAELKRWPLVGRLITNLGTLYIERERRRDTHKINRQAAEALANGDVIAIFPEGTTTDGTMLLPFHGSLLQPIVDAAGHVQPVAIRYRKITGEHNDAPAYVGETSFMASFWRVTGVRKQVVELHVATPLPARATHRRVLSRVAESAIRTALATAAADSAPDTPGDRRA
jgi:1-acyl-sn-glycerol-3-phosphate acyltransferase